jgi:NADH-quinone oxidoreductase subunit L
MFRALLLTFEGEFRGGSDKDPEAQAHGPVHLKESPVPMVLPLVILAIPAVIIGFLVNPIKDFGGIPAHWFTHKLEHSLHLPPPPAFDPLLAIISSLIALLGILLAWAMYKQNPYLSPATMGRVSGPIYTLFLNKYYVDEVYEKIITGRIYYGGIALISDWIDRNIVDRTVNIIGWLGANFGSLIRELQTGQTQMYATVTSVGIIIIAAVYIFGM